MKDHLEPINATLAREQPDSMILQSFNAKSEELCIAFSVDGGPRESEIFLVTFEGAVLFHLPASWQIALPPIRLVAVAVAAARRLIPEVVFDETELQPGGRVVIGLTDDNHNELGFYVVADSIRSTWISWEECEITD